MLQEVLNKVFPSCVSLTAQTTVVTDGDPHVVRSLGQVKYLPIVREYFNFQTKEKILI